MFVVQVFEGDAVSQQEEDTDFDGIIDVRFVAGQSVPLEGKPQAPEEIPDLSCGQFSSFWR